MSDIKIVGWPKRPAEQRRDELEIENAELRKSLSDRESELDITMAEQEQLIDEIAELRKLVEQMKCCANCNGRLWAATGKGDCPKCKDFDKWTPQQPEAAERGGE